MGLGYHTLLLNTCSEHSTSGSAARLSRGFFSIITARSDTTYTFWDNNLRPPVLHSDVSVSRHALDLNFVGLSSSSHTSLA